MTKKLDPAEKERRKVIRKALAKANKADYMKVYRKKKGLVWSKTGPAALVAKYDQLVQDNNLLLAAAQKVVESELGKNPPNRSHELERLQAACLFFERTTR